MTFARQDVTSATSPAAFENQLELEKRREAHDPVYIHIE